MSGGGGGGGGDGEREGERERERERERKSRLYSRAELASHSFRIRNLAVPDGLEGQTDD